MPAPFALFKEFIEVLLTLSTVSFLGATFNFSANSIFSSLLQLYGSHPATLYSYETFAVCVVFLGNVM